ncbi:mechanosensitive ion channel family protein [Qingshengfaniella alkalisoli]|uniref:Small-conductance mechanosensitive channel n=2 Tax=Qingshengfaniella alkalisoli TaxID=2599296 RepID=A0A5B8IAC7_9RHOB|nr:mechanosensitive ion channel family protein [Qingshengfaniella alkalisoli]
MFMALLCGALLLAAPAHAQDAETPPEESVSVPQDLTDETISNDELSLRVLPLTVEDLTALAAEWQAIAKERTVEVVGQQLALDAGEDAPNLKSDLETARAERRAAFAKLDTVVNALAAKGGDQAAVDQYRAYISAVSTGEAQSSDWGTLLSEGVRWATSPTGGLHLLIQIGVIVLALLVLFVVARMVRGGATRMVGRVPKLSKLLQSFIVMVVYWLTIAIGLMIVLSALGVNITPMFALIGGASFIIAFAMQDTLGNLAAGLMIMINRPFDEGDYVTVAGTGGTVKSVSIVSTTITTPDNQVIVIPNSKVWGDIITNVTASDTRRVDLVFGIGYDDSIEEAQRVMEGVVAAHPAVLSEPAPVIRVNELADSSVNFVCRPWTTRDDYWTVYWDLTRQIKEAFDANGISIPFPQTDLHVKMPSSGLPVAPVSAPSEQPGNSTYAANDEGVGDDDQ